MNLRSVTGSSFAVISIILLSALSSVSAQVPEGDAAKGVEVPDETTGVSVTWGEDGEWRRIKSIGEADCLICDRQDITTAKRKAELLAKAAIAKFLNERVTSEEVIEEVTKVLSETNGQSTSVNRKAIQTSSLTLQNSAQAVLSGVLTLEQRSSPAEKFVSVTVGVSRRTINTAASLQNALQGNEPGTPSAKVNPKADELPDAEVRRSKNAEDY